MNLETQIQPPDSFINIQIISFNTMVVQKMFKYRIYPSKKQKIKLINQFKICKEIYNTLLDLNKKLWTTKKFDFDNLVKDIKTTCPEYYFQAHSQVLQNVSDRLSKAFDNFFNRIKLQKTGIKIKAGYPRFKSRIQSITYPQSGFKFINERRLYASKIGNIPIILHRTPKGKVKTMTIKVNKSNQWFIVFSCEIDVPKIKHHSKKKVGIDVGIESFATLSDGEFIENPRFLIKSEKRLKLLNRRFSRKKKGSKNRKKFNFVLNKQYLKISNQRIDFLHKLSNTFANKYSSIAVEDLQIKNMVKNHNLAKHINDASWGYFIQMLSYKAIKSGGELIKVNPRNTSRICSKCGTKVDMPLSKRKFQCPKCFLVLHRDLNSSINIYDRAGLVQISTPVETPPLSSNSGKVSGVIEAGTISEIV